MGSVILPVRFIGQKHQDGCGAAALEMVLRYLEKEADQNDIFDRLNEPDPFNKGHKVITIGSLRREAEARGLAAKSGTTSIVDNKTMMQHVGWFVVEKSLPLIAAQHFSISSTFLHFRVIVGIDNEGNIIAHDPAINGGGAEIKYDPTAFATLWCARDNLTDSGASLCVSQKELTELRPKLPGLGAPLKPM